MITDEDIACLRCEGPAEAGFVAALGRFGGRPATVGSGGSTGVMRFWRRASPTPTCQPGGAGGAGSSGSGPEPYKVHESAEAKALIGHGPAGMSGRVSVC